MEEKEEFGAGRRYPCDLRRKPWVEKALMAVLSPVILVGIIFGMIGVACVGVLVVIGEGLSHG